MKAVIAVAVAGILLASVAIAVFPVEASTNLPPIGRWVDCNDKRYSIGNHGLCDFPARPTGAPEPSNYTMPDNATISLTSTNGTIINLKTFANGTVMLLN